MPTAKLMIWLAVAVAAGLLFGLGRPASATVIGYNIGWTGLNDYTMTGMFSFDDGDAGDGRIDETELLTLMIEGFLNGGSIGSWDLADGLGVGAAALNFNFDPVNELFFVGGESWGPDGQAWNLCCEASVGLEPGFGFGSGSVLQGLSVGFAGNEAIDGDISIIFSAISPTLTASRKIITDVPEPPASLLMLTGLAFMAWLRQRTRSRGAPRRRPLRTHSQSQCEPDSADDGEDMPSSLVPGSSAAMQAGTHAAMRGRAFG